MENIFAKMGNGKEDLEKLASCLCVSCGQIALNKQTKEPHLTENVNGRSGLTGLGTIAKHLARKSSQAAVLLGKSREEAAQVDQWLEFRVAHADRCSNVQEAHLVLKELNEHLSERVYLVGYRVSLADLMLYYGLHPVMAELTHLDKHKYVHLSRWFDQVQHQQNVRQNLSGVQFMKTQIYSDAMAH